jgi:hypothetical protein
LAKNANFAAPPANFAAPPANTPNLKFLFEKGGVPPKKLQLQTSPPISFGLMVPVFLSIPCFLGCCISAVGLGLPSSASVGCVLDDCPNVCLTMFCDTRQAISPQRSSLFCINVSHTLLSLCVCDCAG